MKIVIDIPDEQIKKSLEESKNINEDEGEKGFVHIAMLYTNAQLEFVDVTRKTDFYSCEYKILPKGHGRLIDADELEELFGEKCVGDCGCCMTKRKTDGRGRWYDTCSLIDISPTIIEADTESEG